MRISLEEQRKFVDDKLSRLVDAEMSDLEKVVYINILSERWETMIVNHQGMIDWYREDIEDLRMCKEYIKNLNGHGDQHKRSDDDSLPILKAIKEVKIGITS